MDVSTYPVVRDTIIVIVVVTSVTDAILVVVFLARVGKVGTVVLQEKYNVKYYTHSSKTLNPAW